MSYLAKIISKFKSWEKSVLEHFDCILAYCAACEQGMLEGPAAGRDLHNQDS